MGCVTQCMISMIRAAGLAFLGADGKLFCMDPYAADSKVVDSDQIRSEPKAALKQGKSACLKLEGQGQKISIKGGREECGESGSWI